MIIKLCLLMNHDDITGFYTFSINMIESSILSHTIYRYLQHSKSAGCCVYSSNVMCGSPYTFCSPFLLINLLSQIKTKYTIFYCTQHTQLHSREIIQVEINKYHFHKGNKRCNGTNVILP